MDDPQSLVSVLVDLASALLPFLADCPHCQKKEKKTILKYRGSLKCTCDVGDYDALDKAVNNWKTDERMDQLRKYSVNPGLLSIGMGKGKICHHYTFVACDECIQPEHVSAFTYFPDGWEMTVFKTKRYGPYEEEINFKVKE